METRTTHATMEVARNFSAIRSSRDIVAITHHGRETHALLPIERFAALLNAHGDGADRLPLWRVVADWLPIGLCIISHDYTINLANRTLHAMTRSMDGDLAGRSLFEALPPLRPTLLFSYLQHAVKSRKPCAFEQSSVLRPGRWMQFNIYPANGTSVIVVRDISEDIELTRRANAKEAIIAAMSAHGEVGYLRVNVRGRIERADDALCDLLMLPIEKLVGIPISDIIRLPHRVEFRDIFEAAVTNKRAAKFATEMLRNDGTVLQVTGAIRSLDSEYAHDGAVVLVLPARA